jgi:tetratricopeptide (TPR) repeat protein
MIQKLELSPGWILMQKRLALVFLLLAMQMTIAPAQQTIAPEDISSTSQFLQEISKDEPRSAGEWNDEGTNLLSMGRYSESLDYFNKSIELDAKEPIFWYNKGASLGFLGRYNESLECIDEAIKLDTSYPMAWYNRGLTLCVLGRCPGQI